MRTRILRTSHQMELERFCRTPGLCRPSVDMWAVTGFHKVLLFQSIHLPSLTRPLPTCRLPLAQGARPPCPRCCLTHQVLSRFPQNARGPWCFWLPRPLRLRLNDMSLSGTREWHLQSPVPPLAGGTARNLCSSPCQQPEGGPEVHDTFSNPEAQGTRGLANHPLPVPAASHPLY